MEIFNKIIPTFSRKFHLLFNFRIFRILSNFLRFWTEKNLNFEILKIFSKFRFLFSILRFSRNFLNFYFHFGDFQEIFEILIFVFNFEISNKFSLFSILWFFRDTLGYAILQLWLSDLQPPNGKDSRKEKHLLTPLKRDWSFRETFLKYIFEDFK